MFFKKSAVIVIILFASCASKQQKAPQTWLYGFGQVEKINGRVKELIEKNQNISLDFEYTFDNRGNVVEIVDRGIDIAKYSTAYNNDGQKIEAVGLYFDSGKSIREIYKYDKDEHITRCIGNANNPSRDTDRFIYDKIGNLIVHQQYFEKKPIWIFKYRNLYDKNAVCTGVEQSMTTFRDNFKIDHKDTTRYISFDSNNNWIKAVDVLKDTTTRKITYY